MTGSAARRSMNTNATSSRPPTTNAAIEIGESHAHALPPSRTPRMRSASAAVIVTAPATSMR